jgi:cobalt-zinc-cadmium efflux system protein
MAHEHHSHNHTIELTSLNRAFIAGIILNSVFVIVEVAAGFATNSLALLTDAGHNLSDVAALALSLIAFRLTKVKPTEHFTYGYSKTTVLVALANAVILLIAIGGIGFEALHRFLHPEPMQGNIMAIVAAVGIVVNSASALLFFRDKEHDLNVKGAYLHLAADALVSLGVVVAGIIIIYTNWFWLDSAISLVIMVVILFSTWNLLWDSLRLSLDAVPKNVDMDKVKAEVMKVKGISDIHHIHIWALSTRVNAMTAHLIIHETLNSSEEYHLKEKVKHELLHLNIQHVTLETERGKGKCEDEKC